MDHKKEVTIYDIAESLNISASTVSRGLKDNPVIKSETREKIRKMAEKMGYQQNTFASNLRKNRSNTIGVVVPRLDSYFMSKVISGMEKIANQEGYNLIINQSEESYSKEISCLQTMFNSRVDGLLVSLASRTCDISHLDFIYNKKIPVIFFDRVEKHEESISILIDNFQAAYEVTSHLIEQGCKQIIHVGGNRNRNVYLDRYNGYLKAITDHGLDINESIILENNLNEESGSMVAQQVMKINPRPDAVFTANDTTAVSLICELKKLGIRIPYDIAVAGFNNDPISRVVDPNLTTVHYPGAEMGELAATTLINQISNIHPGDDLKSIYLKHKLIIRESSIRM